MKMAAKWNNLIATAYVADQIRRRYPDLDAYGQKARVARDLDVPSPQSIGQWLTGTRQISPESFEVIATRWGLGYESMLDAAHAWAQQNPAAVGRVEMSAHLSNRAPTLDRIEGYAAAEAAARAIAPRIPDAAWARVRAMSGADVRVVDAESVLGFARLWERVLAGQAQPYPDDGEVPPAVVKPKR